MARGGQDRGDRRTRRGGLTSPALPTGEALWIFEKDLPFLQSLTMPAAWREGQETGAPGEDVQLDAEDEGPLRVSGGFSETQKERGTLQPWRKVRFVF